MVTAHSLTKPIRAVGGFFSMTLDTFVAIFTTRFAWREFLLQTWFFLSPMVFPSSLVSDDWRAIYALNPLVGLVDGLRWSLVGADPPPVADLASLAAGVVILVSGLYYFRKVEVSFADVI